MISKQTTLDLNGPILSFIQQPVSVSINNNGSTQFVGIATAIFPVQNPPNSATGTGIISYRWYEVSFGALIDGTNLTLGASISGSSTDTLTISNVVKSNLGFYVVIDYIPSAYSQPSGSAVSVGTAKSTGNAINEPNSSNIATLTLLPVISVTQNPSSASVAVNTRANFSARGTSNDGTAVSYRWQLNSNDIFDSSNVSGSGTPNLSLSLSNASNNTVRSRISHPTASNSPIFTNSASFTVVQPRQIVNFEYIPLTGSLATIESVNLLNGDYILTPREEKSLISFYAAETDIKLEVDLYSRPGKDRGRFLGGDGGYSRVRFTMPRGVEFIIASFNETGFIVMYRQSRVLLVVATGGNAGTGGNGGPGGGVNVSGGNGFGRNAGTGAQLVLPGTLDQNAFFGSSFKVSTPDANPAAKIPLGGKIANCPFDSYWTNRGFAPCQLLGDTQFYTDNGTRITNSAVISRGFKSGLAYRQVSGYQGGGLGARGGNGGDGDSGDDGSGGGGGGSGYHDGSIQIIQTGLGGSRSSRIVFRAIL